MIIEIDTTILEKIDDLSISQLVFLNLVRTVNQPNNQNVTSLVSRVNDDEIQDLINKGLVTVKDTAKYVSYELTEYYRDLVSPEKSFFDEFYDTYPVMVIRPDGTKSYLRANVNKCRKEYNRIVGKSRAMHEHLMKCLSFEKQEKLKYGKLGYMKTMWKWLVNNEWETFDEQMKNEIQTVKPKYGTDIL